MTSDPPHDADGPPPHPAGSGASPDPSPPPGPGAPGRAARGDASDETVSAIDWAAALGRDEGMASVNWLAADIDPRRGTAEALLADPDVPLESLVAAKSAYKTLRVVGESAPERRLGARWYAAAIAAAIVHHGHRISSQSDAALDRAFAALVDDETMPPRVRELVVRALFRLRSGTLLEPGAGDTAVDGPPSP
jgi:hypothetical protein